MNRKLVGVYDCRDYRGDREVMKFVKRLRKEFPYVRIELRVVNKPTRNNEVRKPPRQGVKL